VEEEERGCVLCLPALEHPFRCCCSSPIGNGRLGRVARMFFQLALPLLALPICWRISNAIFCASSPGGISLFSALRA